VPSIYVHFYNPFPFSHKDNKSSQGFCLDFPSSPLFSFNEKVVIELVVGVLDSSSGYGLFFNRKRKKKKKKKRRGWTIVCKKTRVLHNSNDK